MPIPQVQVTGKILTPNGAGATGGELVVVLSFAGTVRNTTGSVDERVAGEQRFVLGTDGSLTGVLLVPNSAITPAGSFYTVTFRLPNGMTWVEHWQLGATTPIEIGDVPVIAPIPLGLRTTFAQGTATADGVEPGSRRGEVVVVYGATGEEDHAYLILKGWDDIYRAKPLLSGGGPP